MQKSRISKSKQSISILKTLEEFKSSSVFWSFKNLTFDLLIIANLSLVRIYELPNCNDIIN
ncbi:MAG: hypothetical protein K0R18_2260 [Bacillales bacterium]|jgi:hypothetical protein|nr:hypothetical protein [Bacillales bacterium]